MIVLPKKLRSGPTATELRDRALMAMNGEARDLSRADQQRRDVLLRQLPELQPYFHKTSE